MKVGLDTAEAVAEAWDDIMNSVKGNVGGASIAGVLVCSQVEKDLEWFTTYCNVAKRSSTPARLVFIDSFNDWNNDTQLEPAQSYGEDYLNLIRDQFKVN